MLLLIIGLAVVVTMMVTGKVSENEKALEAQKAAFEQKANAKGRVVYAVKDIPEGTAISADALEDREIEQSKIPQDAITSGNLATGRIAKYGIATGQIVSQHDLSPQGISLGFEARLKSGMRAVTFGIDNNSGVAGFVAPESHVDIIAMVGSGADTKAQPLLSDVEIIAVGQTYQKPPGSTTAVPSSSVTVAVSPDDANKLIKGVSAGKLYLTLRNEQDRTPVPTVDITALFAKPPSAESKLAALPPPSQLPPPPIPGAPDFGGSGGMPGAMNSAPPPPPPLHEIEVWSGSRKDVLSVPRG
jgi:pilus assembly protein CpaB